MGHEYRGKRVVQRTLSQPLIAVAIASGEALYATNQATASLAIAISSFRQ
jgi:hypothetical protein